MIGLPESGQWWGKFRKETDLKSCFWHPLNHHCLDVALCFKKILQKMPVLHRNFANTGKLKNLSEKNMERLAFLAGIHDIGKFNHGFQKKIFKNKCKFSEKGHIVPVILAFGDSKLRKKFENVLQLASLSNWFKDEETMFQYLCVVFSHHGRPIEESSKILEREIWEKKEGSDPVQGIETLVNCLLECFSGAFDERNSGLLPSCPKFQHVFCGLIQLADWIASNEKFFPFSETLIDDRFSFLNERIDEVFNEMGISTLNNLSKLNRIVPEISKITGKPWSPRELQKKIREVEIPSSGGSITCLEAETGSGKTEAAFMHFLRLFKNKKVEGMYFALPTRSAAVQIFERIVRYTKNTFPENPPPVVLAVPGYIKVDDVEGKKGTLSSFDVLWPEDEEDRYKYRGWAAEHSKRYMSAPVIVGTIDQIFLSTLMVNYAHLRFSSLLRHFIVVDEVHSSDEYMKTILKEVIKNHYGSGGHSLMMSATLGSEVRQNLLNPDNGVETKSIEEAKNFPYPACTTDKGELIKFNSNLKEKQISISLWNEGVRKENVLEVALEKAGEGAKVIILKNTVKDAVNTQLTLEKLAKNNKKESLLFKCKDIVTLHHGRFSNEDRKTLDREVVSNFGPEGNRKPCVIVTTQTVEQSLDVDFDFMITDLCPMDVLLQRVGRLHRHNLKRPKSSVRPRVKVIIPTIEDLSCFLKENGEVVSKTPIGLGKVYENMLILELTKKELANLENIKIPEMNRELIEKTVNSEMYSGFINSLDDNVKRSKWKNHNNNLIGKKYAYAGNAKLKFIPLEMSFGESECRFPSKLEEKINTRLGIDDRIVFFDREYIRTPFGNKITTLNIPGWMFPENMEYEKDGKARAKVLSCKNGNIYFKSGDRKFKYNRVGLSLVS